jgi:hypothetical protein
VLQPTSLIHCNSGLVQFGCLVNYVKAIIWKDVFGANWLASGSGFGVIFKIWRFGSHFGMNALCFRVVFSLQFRCASDSFFLIWFCLVWFGLIDLVLFDWLSLCIDYSVWLFISLLIFLLIAHLSIIWFECFSP